jgi:hypothetical protein
VGQGFREGRTGRRGSGRSAAARCVADLEASPRARGPPQRRAGHRATSGSSGAGRGVPPVAGRADHVTFPRARLRSHRRDGRPAPGRRRTAGVVGVAPSAGSDGGNGATSRLRRGAVIPWWRTGILLLERPQYGDVEGPGRAMRGGLSGARPRPRHIDGPPCNGRDTAKRWPARRCGGSRTCVAASRSGPLRARGATPPRMPEPGREETVLYAASQNGPASQDGHPETPPPRAARARGGDEVRGSARRPSAAP